MKIHSTAEHGGPKEATGMPNVLPGHAETVTVWHCVLGRRALGDGASREDGKLGAQIVSLH